MGKWSEGYPLCCDRSGECFARRNGTCTILTETCKAAGRCKFKKPDANITNGKYYPYNPKYTK